MVQPPETLPRHVLERRHRRARTLNVLLGGLAVIGVAFGAVQYFEASPTVASAESAAAGESSEESASDASATDAAATALERRDPDDAMALGAVDAPIVLSEWIDFRCPYCAVYSRDIAPELIAEYVDTGRVRIEIHDVAYFGDQSERAAVAARAAGEQGKYFEFLAAVYEAAPESGHPELPEEELIGFAEAVGVPDIASFTSDLSRADLAAAVQESTELAQQLGVTGVPFFAVNGQALSGAQPVDTFRQFLDAQLADAES